MRLYLLTCGTLDVDQTVLTPDRGAGTRLRIPIPAYLLRTDTQTILFDTGMTDVCYTGDPRALAEEGEPDPPWAAPYGGPGDTISGQLAAIGLAPNDVDLVVNSHLHFDHCGGNRHCPHCPIMVQETELESARARRGGESADLGWNAPGLNYQTIQGDHTLAPDVDLLATPGHTPGHQSLLLRLPASGPLLLTFDAVYTAALWQANELGAATDAAAARASMDRLRALASATGALVIFGHDADQWAGLRHPPAFYE